jgi:hypothetical protein
MALQPFVGPWPPFRFLNLHTVGWTPWTRVQPVTRPLPNTEQHKHRIHAQRHPCFEWDSKPTTPVFEQAEIVHALDRAASVIGIKGFLPFEIEARLKY